jgi:hypothetical protein
MSEMKAYIEVPIEKELPTIDGEYFTDQGCLTFAHGRFFSFIPKWWLKEIPLEDLMVKFAQFCNGVDDDNPAVYKELLKDFNKQEGIL